MEEEGAEDLQEVYDNVKLMKKSGQTEQERRTLRRSQRLLKQQLAETDYDVALAQQENDILFGSVCFAREALLDADNLDAISRRLLKTLERGTNVGGMYIGLLVSFAVGMLYLTISLCRFHVN